MSGPAGTQGTFPHTHFPWWDDRFATDVGKRSQAGVEARLLAAGAPPTCWVISESSKIDATELPLTEALARMWNSREASVASCIPGRLAYYHDIDEQSYLILQRA